MRTFLIVFLGVCGIVPMFFLSCGMSKKEKAEQARVDSLYRVDSLAEALRQKDSLMLRDSVDAANFTSPDLQTFWLRGRVKELVETTDGNYTIRIRFDEDGKLISHSAYNDENSKIVRDSEDRIISLLNIDSWEGGNDGLDFKYYGDGSVSQVSHWQASHDTYMYNVCNEKGWPKAGAIADGEDNYSGQVTYEYPNVDYRGNWTRQIIVEKWPNVEDSRIVVDRQIYYYK